MTDIILAVLIVIVYAAQEGAKFLERIKWERERSQLLDRIMSRDYEQYAGVNIKVNETKAPTKVVSVDELTKMMEEREQTQGIPI